MVAGITQTVAVGIDVGRYELIGAHIDNGAAAAAGVRLCRVVHEAPVAGQVRADTDGHSRAVSRVDAPRAGRETQVVIHRADDVVCAIRIHEERIRVDIARAGVAALHVAMGDDPNTGTKKRAVHNFIRGVSPEHAMGLGVAPTGLVVLYIPPPPEPAESPLNAQRVTVGLPDWL